MCNLYNYIVRRNKMKLRLYSKSQGDLFPVYISTAAVNRLQEKINRQGGFNTHQLFVVSNGNGILRIADKTYKLAKNDFFYIAKETPHEYYGTDTEFAATFMSFFGKGFEGIKEYYNLNNYGVYFNKNKGSFANRVKNLYENIEKHELSVLCSETYSAIIAFFEESCVKEYNEIEEVRNFIISNYSTLFTLDDILKFYPYSKSKLCRDFKEKYQCTIFDFLTATRLKHAKFMLTNHTNLKLREISQSCGFSDISYFCKMYKKYYKTTPKSKGM